MRNDKDCQMLKRQKSLDPSLTNLTSFHALKMQHRVRCTPLHFVIPTTIGAAELLINCSPALLFRNKWGGRVDSYYRGGIQISWHYMAEASPSFSFAISVGIFLFSFVRPNLGYFASKIFQNRPRAFTTIILYRLLRQ